MLKWTLRVTALVAVVAALAAPAAVAAPGPSSPPAPDAAVTASALHDGTHASDPVADGKIRISADGTLR